MTPEEIEQKTKAAAEQFKKEVKESTDLAVKAAVESALSDVKATAKQNDEALQKLATDLKAATERADLFETKLNRSKMGGGDGEQENPALKAFLDHADEIKQIKAGSRKSITINLDAKAAVIITTGSLATVQPAASSTMLPGVVTDPKRREHIRAYMAVGQMSTGSATYLQQNGTRTRGAGMVGEGGVKPRSDVNFVTKRLDAKKIANTFKITEETVEDIPLLMSTIQQEGIYDIDYIEDDEILFGDGTGNHLEGIYTQATAFTGGGVTAENANKYDVLRAAIAQLSLGHFRPTLIVLSPVDVADMDLEKGEDGHYLVPMALFGTTLPVISGVRIVENTAMPAGDFLVGDFAQGAQLFDRTGLSIRIYDQNEDDATKNLLLVVIEKRVALKVGYPKAFIKGSFETAIPLIEGPAA